MTGRIPLKWGLKRQGPWLRAGKASGASLSPGQKGGLLEKEERSADRDAASQRPRTGSERAPKCSGDSVHRGFSASGDDSWKFRFSCPQVCSVKDP